MDRLDFHKIQEFRYPAAASRAQALIVCGMMRGEFAMEMHSRQSLEEVHNIGVRHRRHRSRLVMRLLVTRIFAFFAKAKRTIEAELAARRAMNELAEMDDHMLRDLGLVRGEIASALRRPREYAGTDDPATFANETGGRHPVLPTVQSPDIDSEAEPWQEPRRVSAAE